MELKYNLTIHELMDFFGGREHKGFSEQEIQGIEQVVEVALPPAYRSFVSKYGVDDITAVFNNLFTSSVDFATSYQMIHELLEDFEDDFKEAVQKGTQEEYLDNEYFSLWQLPEEEWHTITQNYVLIGCDREGIVYAGYLMQDLLDGKEDPPIYVSCDDDVIEFKRWTDNTEQFLIEMVCETAWEERKPDSCYDPKERMSIEEIFAAVDVKIDGEQLEVTGHVGTCLDTANEKLYAYFDYETFQRVFSVSRHG